MNVVVENLPNCITTLRIELEADKVNKVWDAVTGDYTKYAKIPGYRAGKAPKSVIEKKFKKEIRARNGAGVVVPILTASPRHGVFGVERVPPHSAPPTPRRG